MHVGILLITHPGIGQSLLANASRLLGQLPLKAEAFEPSFDTPIEQLLPLASAAMRRVEQADGVLLLTDIYGATPARLAKRLCELGTPSRRVSGVSLPMLLRVMNYAEQSLDELALTAAAGGRNGVQLDDA